MSRLLAFVMLLGSIVLSAAAQLLMKAGLLALPPDALSSPLALLHAPQSAGFWAWPWAGWLLAGIICYGLSMLAWLLALMRFEVSYAYPMLGLSYVLVYLGAGLWPRIGEPFSLDRSLAILLILLGVALVNLRPKRPSSGL